MKALALILFGLLSAIAALHVYWGFGGLWPAADKQALIDIVIGAPDWTEMPPMWMTLVVAALIFAAGLVALFLARVVAFGPRILWLMGGGVLTLVFAARGAAGYLTDMRGVTLTEPFATYDVWLYSPLCLAIGAAFAALTLAPTKS